MIGVKVNVPLVYGTGVIAPGMVPAVRQAGLAGFDPTAYAVNALPGMNVPTVSGGPGRAIRVLVNQGNNWRGQGRR